MWLPTSGFDPTLRRFQILSSLLCYSGDVHTIHLVRCPAANSTESNPLGDGAGKRCDEQREGSYTQAGCSLEPQRPPPEPSCSLVLCTLAAEDQLRSAASLRLCRQALLAAEQRQPRIRNQLRLAAVLAPATHIEGLPPGRALRRGRLPSAAVSSAINAHAISHLSRASQASNARVPLRFSADCFYSWQQNKSMPMCVNLADLGGTSGGGVTAGMAEKNALASRKRALTRGAFEEAFGDDGFVEVLPWGSVGAARARLDSASEGISANVTADRERSARERSDGRSDGRHILDTRSLVEEHSCCHGCLQYATPPHDLAHPSLPTSRPPDLSYLRAA